MLSLNLVSPNSKSYSENLVQTVLLEHSVQTELNNIWANGEFKPKKDSLLSENSVQIVVAHNVTNISVKIVLKLARKFSPNSTKCNYDCDGVANYIVCWFWIKSLYTMITATKIFITIFAPFRILVIIRQSIYNGWCLTSLIEIMFYIH